MAWDPRAYQQFATERSRPFFDLMSQVTADDPNRVVDLGCGTGELTATLRQRWPEAMIIGLDSSAEMLARSAALADARLRFELRAAELFDASGTDVLLSNALLQWVPTHSQLLERWSAEINPGGWLAFQVPSNFEAPSHTLMREVAESPRWAHRLAGVLRHDDAVRTPQTYLDLLANQGLSVSAWQTGYLHVLTGTDPVLAWVRGTGLRPVLQALDAAEQEEYTAEYAARLRTAYPARSYGTPLEFRRTFVVAHKPQPGSSAVHRG